MSSKWCALFDDKMISDALFDLDVIERYVDQTVEPTEAEWMKGQIDRAREAIKSLKTQEGRGRGAD